MRRSDSELEATNLDESSSTSVVRKRKMITSSVSKNRSNYNGANFGESKGRPSKKTQIGDSEDFIDVPMVAALHPHRPQ